MKKRQFLNPAPIFEELEPRLLFSADGAEALAAPVVEQAYEEPVVIAAPESPVEATAVDQPTEQKTTAAADSPAVGEVAPAVADTAPSETSAPLTERQAQEKDVAESTGSETTEEEATGENITKQQTSTNQTDGTAVNTDLKQESVEQTGIVTESAIGEKRRETVLPDTETSKELVLVNDNVQNYEELVDDIGRTDSGERSIEVVVLDDKQDGITQVNEILHEHNDLDAVHFITHSSDGFLQLGSTWYTTDSLDKQTDDLSGWSKALDEGGDLLFYGCNLAQGENGKLFVDTLAELTDLDVAASDDMTGSAEHVGDWDLEYTVGTVDATSPFTSVRPENWDHALVTYTVTNTNDSGTGSLRQAINDANNNSGSDTITFNIDTSDSGYVFYEDDGTVNSLTGTVTHTPTQADTDFSDGWYRIQLSSALPGITDAVIIDGWSQSGYTNHPIIELDGSDAGSNCNALSVQGGNSTIQGLVINAFDGDGIQLLSAGNNTIVGNYIGTDVSGTLKAGVAIDGIYVETSNNVIGGTTAGAGNTITDNAFGIRLDTAGTGNSILGNSIYDNSELGIDFGNSGTEDSYGVTANDTGDGDTGTNNLQNYPVLSSAGGTDSQITVAGTLNSTANSYFRIEFFANTSGEASGHGEGQTYLGFANVATDGSGDATIDTTLTASVVDGAIISATATKCDSSYTTFTDTSEFAQNVTASILYAPVNNVPGAQATNEDTTLVFDTANGNLISITDVDAGASQLETSISVNDGILTLSGTTGLTFISGSDSSSAMTIQGTLADINTALDGLSFTPDANFNGAVSLQIETHDDTHLIGAYTFENLSNLGKDSGAGISHNGTVIGATPVSDATRGNVLSFNSTQNDGVEINGLFGEPTDVTLSAWINFTGAEMGEVISIGDSVAIRAGYWGNYDGIQGFFYKGYTDGGADDWGVSYSDTPISGTGWHHVAYTFDDANDKQSLYLDGVEITYGTFTESISYTPGTYTAIGKHPFPEETEFFFDGQIDDARVYDRALSATEIAQIMHSSPRVDIDTVTITVNAVNDPPVIGGDTSGSVTEDVDPNGNGLLETTGILSISDPDAGESSFIAETITGIYGDLIIDAAGSWNYGADNTQVAIQQLDVTESITDTLAVTTADGTTHNVVITINGAEDTSVIGGTTTGTVSEDGSLTTGNALTITDVDVNDNPISFNDEAATAGDNGYGTFEITGNIWIYNLNNGIATVQALDAGETLTDTHTFTASDGSTREVSITITGAEEASVTGDTVNENDTEPSNDSKTDSTVDNEYENSDNTDKGDDEETILVLFPNDQEVQNPGNGDNRSDDIPGVQVTDLENNTTENRQSTGVETQSEDEIIVPVNPEDSGEYVDISNEHDTLVTSEEQPYLPLTSQPKESYNNSRHHNKVNTSDAIRKFVKQATQKTLDFIAPPVSAAPIYSDSFNPADFEVKSDVLRTQLDGMHRDMDQAFEQSKNEHKIKVYVASGMSASFAVGAAGYLLRAGSLMSSFLATVPLWKSFDPIAILAVPKKKQKKNEETADENAHPSTAATDQKAESMFVGKENQ